MPKFRSGLRGLALLYDLGFDRVVAPVLIAFGLALAAHIALGVGSLDLPGNLFLN